VAWNRLQWPLHLGGLGIIDLWMLSVALRARWLWLLRTDPGRAWISLSMGEDSLTKAFFDASIRLVLGNDATILFWVDPWLEGARLADIAPDLVAASSRRGRRWRTVADALQDHSWIQDITRALTVRVLMQYIKVRQCLQAIQLIPKVADKFIWRWEASGSYSCHSAYRALIHGQDAVLGARQL
jgi:hypothetical protein